MGAPLSASLASPFLSLALLRRRPPGGIGVTAAGPESSESNLERSLPRATAGEDQNPNGAGPPRLPGHRTPSASRRYSGEHEAAGTQCSASHVQATFTTTSSNGNVIERLLGEDGIPQQPSDLAGRPAARGARGSGHLVGPNRQARLHFPAQVSGKTPLHPTAEGWSLPTANSQAPWIGWAEGLN